MDRLEDVDPRVIAPFSKDDARLVQVAAAVCADIRHGMRAGERVEVALQSGHVVHVPMLDSETEEFTLLTTEDWRIPTSRHGQFRAVVEYLRLGGDWRLSPEILISRAEIRKLQQQTSGIHR